MQFKNLQASVKGDVYHDRFRRQLLATDASIFQKMPAAVVYPRCTQDVVATVNFARLRGLAIHARGAGSDLCGAAVGDGIVLDFSKYMHRLIRLDPAGKTFTCEPGYRLGELEARLKGSGLFFPPDPSSGEYATLGGMYATNASGAHSVKYGNVVDYLVDARVVFSSGRVATLSETRRSPPQELPANLQALYRLYENHTDAIENAYPGTRFNTAGYNLRGLVQDGRLDLQRLLAGSEGTLGVTTRLTFRLLAKPTHDSLVVAFMDDIVAAARAVQAVLPLGPSGIEIMDKSLLALARSQDSGLHAAIPAGVDSVLLIEFDGLSADDCAGPAAAARELIVARGYSSRVHLAVASAQKAKFWAVRKAAVPILYKLKGDKKVLALIEDAAVPTDRLVDYFGGIYAILERHRAQFVTFGHIAKGLLHTRPLLNLKDPRDVAKLRPIADEVFQLVRRLGGAISGEHGDGRLRSAYVRAGYAHIYDLFRQTKSLLDPAGLLNPELITHHDPDQMQRDLRYGLGYRRRSLAAPRLNWPAGFEDEVEKCHGCSKCTTITAVTRMCPIYKATRDEAAAPKAKANILRGLISGVISDRSLYERRFQAVIDQCVNCGSCARECPSRVDIPKLAMEARAQYTARFGVAYKKRLVTEIETAGRIGHRFGDGLKPLMQNRLVRHATQTLTGIAARRDAIVFAKKTLHQRLPPRQGRGTPSVLYFAGCYATYIEPAIGQALVAVLSRMGMRVHTPAQHCCGLPMLSKGMVPRAGRKIVENLDRWSVLAERVDHIVVSCSSCGHALRQDWPFLLDDPRVEAVGRKLIHISRLVNDHFERLEPLLGAGADLQLAYHAPCHLRIQPHPDSSIRMLQRLAGVRVTDLKSNCCGMIGSWGMTADNYDLSRTIGSPMIAALNRAKAAMGVTDCPTCRLQMKQFSPQPIEHPIEIVARRIGPG